MKPHLILKWGFYILSILIRILSADKFKKYSLKEEEKIFSFFYKDI